jgi:hypothetical protein
MATTDAKSGFRLPWSADRNESDAQVGGTEGVPAIGDPAQATSQHESPTMTDTAPQTQETGMDPSSTGAQTAQAEPGTTLTRKPNKFMADLTRAMQAAAEAARADTLERFGAEAKAHIESIHASTADEATELRKKADDDIAGVREWSKTEIARIREETDERIAHRKSVLEREIETHAAQIEERIERVQQRVAGFESDMASFFQRLLAEEDPTRFASMAESLPEPPPFDADAAWDPSLRATATSVETPVVEAPVEPAHVAEAPTESSEPELTAMPEASESTGDYVGESAAPFEADASAETAQTAAPVTPVEEVPSGWGELAAPEPAEAQAPTTEDQRDTFAVATEESAPEEGATQESDPRLEALGLDRDFAAAEAEAGAFPTESETPQEEIPTIADDALAARLAGLVPDTAAAGETATTRVVVTGLVSVASIAGFKRNLARVSGVHSVGVTSGPDGEFVFAVAHDADMALGESIATLPGFGARVTNETAGELTVAARDPEAEG